MLCEDDLPLNVLHNALCRALDDDVFLLLLPQPTASPETPAETLPTPPREPQPESAPTALQPPVTLEC